MQKVSDELQVNYTLNPEESHRFRAILGEAVERLQLLNLVTENSTRRLASKRGEPAQNDARSRKDLDSLMVKQKELERQFEHLMHKRWTLKGLSNKAKLLRNQQELKELEKELKESTGNISQNLKDHPTIHSNIEKIQKDRKELEELLQATADELQGFTFQTLIDRVASRTEEQVRLFETQENCNETKDALNDLEKKYDSECERFEREIEERDKEISKLTQTLKDLKKVTRLALDFERDTAMARAETKARQRKRQLDELRDKIKKAKGSLDRDLHVHTKTIEFLSKHEKKLISQDEDWNDRHKREFTAKSNQYDDLNKKRLDSEKHLEAHQMRWDKHEREKKALADEAAIRKKQEEAKDRLKKAIGLAQCKVRFWMKVKKAREKSRKKKPKRKPRKKKKNS